MIAFSCAIDESSRIRLLTAGIFFSQLTTVPRVCGISEAAMASSNDMPMALALQ